MLLTPSCVAVCCSVLQCAVVCCSVVQCVAVILEAAGKQEGPVVDAFLLCLAVCCDVLQCVAVSTRVKKRRQS